MLEQLKATTQFENDGAKSRMVLEVTDTVPLITYQVEMIRSNPIPGLLPLDVRRVDSHIRFYYDVTGKWRLKDLLDNKEFSGAEFTSLLERMIQTLTASEAYLLDLSQFVLDEEHVFLDGDMTPHLLYLPVKGRQNIHQRYKELLLQMIVYRAKLKDQDSGPLLSGILNYLKREHFNLYEFQKALRNLGSPVPGSAESSGAKPEPVAVRKAAPVSLGDLIPVESRQTSPPDNPPIAAPSRNVSKQTHGSASDRTQAQKTTETITKRRYTGSAVAAALLFQGVLAVGAFYGFGPVYTATEDWTTACAAIALMVLCLDGLVLKSLLKPENRVTVQVPVKKKASPKQTVEPVKPATASAPAPAVNLEKQIISNASLGMTSDRGYDTELLTTAEPAIGSEDTVVLSAQPAAPYLVRKGPVQEIIRLKQPALVLGRQADLADHVINDPAIGRMHAEVSWINNLCQIRDLNSKNGTFVNGQRLAGPQPINVFVGDEIRLGSLEYILAQD